MRTTSIYSQPPVLLTIGEAAARLRIGRSTAYELINAGKLEVVHIGRSVRVPTDALENFVLQLRRRAGDGPTTDTPVS